MKHDNVGNHGHIIITCLGFWIHIHIIVVKELDNAVKFQSFRKYMVSLWMVLASSSAERMSLMVGIGHATYNIALRLAICHPHSLDF